MKPVISDYGLYIPEHITVSQDDLVVYRKRNNRLLAFFNNMMGSDECYITLVGTIHQPRVVVNDTYVIGTWCQNFDLHFLDETGESFGILNLTHDISTAENIDLGKLRAEYGHFLKKAIKLPTYAIKDPETGLFFFGFQPNRGYKKLVPLFCRTHPRIYILHSKAMQKLQELKTLGYDLVLDGEPTELSIRLTENDKYIHNATAAIRSKQ